MSRTCGPNELISKTATVTKNDVIPAKDGKYERLKNSFAKFFVRKIHQPKPADPPKLPETSLTQKVEGLLDKTFPKHVKNTEIDFDYKIKSKSALSPMEKNYIDNFFYDL